MRYDRKVRRIGNSRDREVGMRRNEPKEERGDASRRTAPRRAAPRRAAVVQY